MRTLHRYLFGDFLAYAFATALVLIFVVCVALVFGTADLMTRGVALRAFFKVFALGIPSIFPFAIPISLLTATLLLFGRLSADSEITAMKSCGISLWSALSPLLLFALLAAILCAYLNNRTVPENRRRQRMLLQSLTQAAPLDFLPAGQTIDEFPGLTVWIERIEDDTLYNVRIYDRREDHVARDITAARGVARIETGGAFWLDLYEVTIDPFDGKRPGPALVGKWALRFPDIGANRIYRERPPDFSFEELRARMAALDRPPPGLSPRDLAVARMQLRVEFHKRLALAAACFSFVLLGAPLGVKAHRKESSIGGAISLAVLLVFYVFLLVAESLGKTPGFRADLVIWVPVLLSLVLGWALMRKADR